MILVGMPDSPYVRRCAVSMKLMGIAFEHQQVSVFRHFDRFRAINPVVKAPSFICDDGTVLMDSTLILDYLEHCVAPSKALMPATGAARQEALRLIGLAMAACEKCVQMVYEKEQRPQDKRHEPWFARIAGQAHTAFALLETAAAGASPWLQGGRINAADVAVACAWRFGQYYNSVEVPVAAYPALVAYSQRAEALPEFASTPLD
ncbi:MAG: glutathione S-transferase family protein [Pseudomonadota bacterium]|nr:glutathione S-transferase family protein [Pseudomonadota bacterium]